MLREDCHQVGRGERTTWEEHTTWITIHDKQHGSGQRQTSTLGSSEHRWNNSNLRRDRGIKLVCCQKIELVQTPLRFQIDKVLLPTRLIRLTMQMQRKWWLLGLLRLGLVSYLPDGSKGILQKVEPTLLTTTLVLPRGSTQGDSNTSACTDRTQVLVIARFSNNPCHSSGHCLVGGKCDSRTLRACTSSITIRRLRPGTTLDCPLRWIKTFHNTNVTLGES